MQHSELVAALVKPGGDILAQLTPEDCHILHMAVGLAGEVGELAEAISLGNGAGILEELGDLEFFLEAIRQVHDFRDIRDRVIGPSDEMDALLQLSVRSCAVLDEVKSSVIYRKAWKVQSLKEAAADVDLLLSYVCACYGATRDQVRQHNVEKLTVRYGKRYSDIAAQARLDKA